MKKLFLLTGLVLLAFGCTKNSTIEKGSSRAISFETHVGKSSRAVPVTAFKEGDAIGVMAYQSPTNWATDGAVGTPYIDNLSLTKAGDWELELTRYWEKSKKYTFFGYAPYSSSVLIENGVLKNYVVASDLASQQDFMVSIPSDDTKDMSYDGVTAPSTVKFAFAHAMSQVKFSVATNYDYSSLYTIEMKSVSVRNISNKGDIDLAPSAISANPWINQSAYPNDYAANITFTTPMAFSHQLTALTADKKAFMLMPQSFADAQIEFLVHVINKGGSAPTPTGDYSVAAKITGSWERNKVYHYEATLDMEQILGLKAIIITNPSITDWETEQDHEIYPPLVVNMPDAEAGSTPENVLVTKSGSAGASSEVNIESSVKDLMWTAEVKSSVTRAEEETTWLTLADDAQGTNAQNTKSGTGDKKIYIYITERNPTDTPRKAYINIARQGMKNITITVTQQAGTPITPITPTDPLAWASSNVYWDGAKLTFDTSNPNATSAQKQGVFFRWSSLVALDAATPTYSPSCILYSPSGKKYAWNNIPLIPYSSLPDNKNTSCLIPAHEPKADVGDICKYISDMGWVTGEWRVPTGAEFASLYNSNKTQFGKDGAADGSNKNGTALMKVYFNPIFKNVTYRLPLSFVRLEGGGEYTPNKPTVQTGFYMTSSYRSNDSCHTISFGGTDTIGYEGFLDSYSVKRGYPMRCVRAK